MKKIEPVVFSTDLPEPTMCDLDSDGYCTRHDDGTKPTECTCKMFCGECSEAGCCWCAHTDIYELCPRGGGWCFPDCGDPEAGCSPAQRAFAQAAHRELEATP